MLLLSIYAALVAAAIWTGLLLGFAGAIATLGLRLRPQEVKAGRLLILVGAMLAASLSLMSLGAASVGTGVGLFPAIVALAASAALGYGALLFSPQP